MWSRLVMSQAKHKSYFIAGVVLGLWVSLAVIPLEEEAAPCAAAERGAPGDWEPRHEERPAGPRAPARALARPRYYSTELGMRGSLMAGVLTSEAELAGQAALVNRSLGALPAVRLFLAAGAGAGAAPPLPNVVAFTDTREMLKPFHALKYLADNYLEEYDFFFLVTDATFVDARRLLELAAGLSVSRDVYMGEPADDDSQYCSLDGGVLLSNSVLRAVHGELEWCVRNSYSPHHHENLGRCVLHAAHAPCAAALHGRAYAAARLPPGAPAAAAAGALTARPARGAALLRLRAAAARERLRAARAEAARLRAFLWRNSARHPPGYRNATWPAGLRADPGLAPPPPADRHAHLRWTAFNASHALMPDERRAAGALAGATAAAVRLLLREAERWARRRWPAAAAVALLEGAWRWEPAVALRYRLLLRLTDADGAVSVRQLEAVRALGAARLVPVPYVTESARVTVVVGVRPAAPDVQDAAALVARWRRAAAADGAVRLLLVALAAANHTALGPLRAALAGDPAPELLAAPEAEAAAGGAGADGVAAGGAALRAAAARLPRDALLLLAPPHLDFSVDFLNRVRMNTIPGVQWFSPLPFARYAQAALPRGAAGAKPAAGAGHFLPHSAPLLAVYRRDLDTALAAWRGPAWAAEAALARSALRCVRAPEPGAVLAPRPAPCAPRAAACLRALRPQALPLGARAALAQLLLETESGVR